MSVFLFFFLFLAVNTHLSGLLVVYFCLLLACRMEFHPPVTALNKSDDFLFTSCDTSSTFYILICFFPSNKLHHVLHTTSLLLLTCIPALFKHSLQALFLFSQRSHTLSALSHTFSEWSRLFASNSIIVGRKWKLPLALKWIRMYI